MGIPIAHVILMPTEDESPLANARQMSAIFGASQAITSTEDVTGFVSDAHAMKSSKRGRVEEGGAPAAWADSVHLCKPRASITW